MRDGNCVFLETADGHCDWVEVDTLANYEVMNNFYGLKKNRMENYDTDEDATNGTKKILRLPLIPAHVGRKVIEGEMTPWEVVLPLNKIMKGNTQALKDLLNPAMAWALQACCKTGRGGRRMELQMTTVRQVSPAAERRMRAQVNTTLGEWTGTAVAPARQAAPATT